jgi:hypothetical protein
MIVRYGERIKNWRNDRDVTRKEIHLESGEIEDAIIDYLKKKNMPPEGIEDNRKFDSNLEYLSFGRGDWYETPSIVEAEFSFMVDGSEVKEER